MVGIPGRPLVASFVVGVIMGDLQTAMIVGIALQIMYMGNVTPGGAVAWDLSYATYIGTAGALVFGKGMESTQVIGLAVVFAGIGGLVGQMVWNLSYALNLPLNRLANKYAEAGGNRKDVYPQRCVRAVDWPGMPFYPGRHPSYHHDGCIGTG